MTCGLVTPQGSELSPSFRAHGESRGAESTEERRRSLAVTESHVRVAALLSAISRNNHYEGRDPAVIPDCFSSGFVADLLGLSVSRLSDALVELKRRGFIQAEGSALRLTDLPALERLVESDGP
jgi:CRP-like cAMP-binding protein